MSGDLGEWCGSGLNFVTLRPQTEILHDYVDVLQSVFTPEAFFARLRHMIGSLGQPGRQSAVEAKPISQTFATFRRLSTRVWTDLRKHPDPIKRRNTRRDIRTLGRLVRELVVDRPHLLVPAFRLVSYCRRTNPARLSDAVRNLVFFLHVSRYLDVVVADVRERIRILEAEPKRLTAVG